ncbi:hypothetical protein COT97_04020 [Candidatus Falkowbacteria bacterium CG10_big_fil_rev_8_21_14_0_10_39_11]|uniref:Uncharacterized protein n=1 Tax=Candidatus Falkowbacteria bacterium CG10_big_fil_rev_8_21_14_0_10_39_11 TaxID=1974565 RepID=A0A2H0V497_9BACT|nr:MAG: hypothetical protein COT97_04020 [Candidatus Falkowbacteria bacterium CG10_big_fil_rev_8_21_14_0_10_39_11]
MNTRTKLFSLLVALALVLFAFGCGPEGEDVEPGPDSVTSTDTSNPGNDTVAPPDDVVAPPGDADTPDPDVVDPPTCPDGQTELTLDDATECVTTKFADAVDYLEGLELTQTEPNTEAVTITLGFHHVSDFDVAMIQCEGFSKFFVRGLNGVVRIACIDESLSLSMCEVDTGPCAGGTLTGQITYSKSSTPEVVLRTDYCGDGWCDNFVYESGVIE